MAPDMFRIRLADSPNNTVGSVHVPTAQGSVNTKQTPSGTAKQQPKWLKQHQPTRRGGTK
ncbi:MAG TPA: hypothetical protein VFN11_22380 [Ktedonobacterales bacterium]|nr:hypothetical protein [Ktedonobacterales bacterium]